MGQLQVHFLNFINTLRIQDLIDMALVWLVIYRVLILIRKTGTMQMLSGLGILAIGYILSIWFELLTFNWLLEKFFSNLFLILVVLFQAEIRRALAQIGSNPFFGEISNTQEALLIDEVIRGVLTLGQKGCGCLIVIEREILTDYHVELGTEMDAKVSSELIQSIFHPTSPIHDGAVIIRAGKIQSAGTFLPLSKNPALDKNLGTRHRAAIGLTEETDALVIVVSEENKSIGVVQAGVLTAPVTEVHLRKLLFEAYGLKYRESETTVPL